MEENRASSVLTENALGDGIREATKADIPRIVELGRRFLAEGPYKDQLEDNAEQNARLADLLISNSQAKVIVGEEDGIVVGLFALILFSHYFSGELTAGEIMWYVQPESRPGGIGIRLLSHAEKFARSLNAVRMQLTAPTEEVGKLYNRCGYKQIEVSYQRKL